MKLVTETVPLGFHHEGTWAWRRNPKTGEEWVEVSDGDGLTATSRVSTEQAYRNLRRKRERQTVTTT